MKDRKVTIAARWIFPVTSAPIADGKIELDASFQILEIGRRCGMQVDIDLGNCAILPLLINAHTHLDLTGMAGLNPPDSDYIRWIKKVIQFRMSQSRDTMDLAIQNGFQQILDSGSIGLGDISTTNYPAFKDHSEFTILRFFEVLGLTTSRQEQSWRAYQRLEEADVASGNSILGLSPHAPYSTSRKLFELAGRCSKKVCSHIGEFLEERDLLENHEGPFAEFLKEFHIWQPDELAPSWEWLLQALPDYSLVVHGNYLSPEHLVKKGHSVVYCPRTHSAFEHPPHPFREFMAAGINVCLGTDSLASNPDLDTLSEARHVHRLYPEVPGENLLRMITQNGAKALNLNRGYGRLEIGFRSPGFLAIPLSPSDPDDPYSHLFESDTDLKVPRKIIRSDTISAYLS
ncbi:amidohydrolase family protein [Telmatocola sphagniphila]|uniref:Amidohydrolase family protein n=1 Tax=Telmatocola sphagniphila TaxID=1123043 RepID=A0A8E6B7B6_9BACT|nr:amidohydrolase family protein [Telmatocola sphagniphila]QVL33450.1 amidohydrolase family protein [Telmatocola sphagniphila]